MRGCSRGVSFCPVESSFAICYHPCSIETMTSPNTLQFHNKTLWAKTTDRTDTADGFPLHTHLADVTGMVDWVIARWVSPDTYTRLSNTLGCDLSTVVKFCAAAHDLGKASPFFQHCVPHLAVGLPDKELAETYVPHSIISAKTLRGFLTDRGFTRAARTGFELVVAGHHGRFPTERGFPAVCELESPDWQDHRLELLEHVLDWAEVDVDEMRDVKWSTPLVSTVTGLVIAADWLGSNTDLYPLDAETAHDYDARRERALDRIDLGDVWHPHENPEVGWQRRFDLSESTELNAMQQAVLESAGPGLTIVEHSTGGGKTAAALMAAEKIAYEQGRSGIYMALPTRTVATAMYETVTDWLSGDTGGSTSGSSVAGLVHGKAERSARFAEVASGDVEGVSYNEWFHHKRAALMPVSVGTIDHVLMCGLKTPHVVLRHVGLLSKVLVIDEIHSSDTYMETYLKTLVAWCGALGVPVIALSATLSNERRQLLVDAYRRGQGHSSREVESAGAASQITRVNELGEVSCAAVPVGASSRKVKCGLVGSSPDIEDVVATVDEHGGVVGLIADTVTRAQDWYEQVARLCEGTDVEIVLLHSRFTDTDRAAREQDLVERCGRGGVRPDKLIVVSTQVIEQALDIDFDYMVSDVAPVDALIQRAGRVHRHAETRRPTVFATPRIDICGVDGAQFARGVDTVYSPWMLLKTLQFLRGRDELDTGRGVVEAMDCVFNTADSELVTDSDIAERIDEAKAAHEKRFSVMRALSRVSMLPDVRGPVSLMRQWSVSSTTADESVGAVRLPDGSVEVELVVEGSVDTLRIPAWWHTSTGLARWMTSRGAVRVEVDEDGCFDLGRGRLRYDSEVGLHTVT